VSEFFIETGLKELMLYSEASHWSSDRPNLLSA